MGSAAGHDDDGPEARRPLAGIGVVAYSPPCDNARITALIAPRVIADTLGSPVGGGHRPRRVEGTVPS